MDRALYVCPKCGHVANDDQSDMDGHWEHGGSQTHADDPEYSYWTLACAKCGEISDMKRVPTKGGE